MRERIFEPAYSDLLYAWLHEAPGGRRLPFGFRALSTFVGCVPIALPRFFMRDGQLTRLGRAAVWGAAVLTTILLVVMNLIRPYVDYGN